MEKIPPTIAVANGSEEPNQFPPFGWNRIDKEFLQFARKNTEHMEFFLENYPKVSDELTEEKLEVVQNKLSNYLRAIQN